MSTPITNLCARAGFTYQAANIDNQDLQLNAMLVNLSDITKKFVQQRPILTEGSPEFKTYTQKIEDLRAAETTVKVAMDANATKKQLIEQAMGRLN